MWSGHAPRRADLSDELAALDGVTDRDEGAAQVMIDRHEAVAVVYVHGNAAIEEVAHERHHAAIGHAHRCPLRSGNIQSIVPGAPDAVHLATRAEHARDPRRARANERLTPEAWHHMGTPRRVSRQDALGVDPRLERAVGRRRVTVVRADLLVDRHLALRDGHKRAMSDHGAVPANRKRLNADRVARGQRDGGERFAVAKMQRLTGDLPGDRAGGRHDDERALARRGRLPGEVLYTQSRTRQQPQHHVETRDLAADVSLGGRSKYASISSRSSSSS